MAVAATTLNSLRFTLIPLLLLRLLRLFCTSLSLLGLIVRWFRPSPRPGTIRAGIFSVGSLSAAGGLITLLSYLL